MRPPPPASSPSTNADGPAHEHSFRIGRVGGIEIGRELDVARRARSPGLVARRRRLPVDEPSLPRAPTSRWGSLPRCCSSRRSCSTSSSRAPGATRRHGVSGITLWASVVSLASRGCSSASAELRIALAGPLVSLLLGLVFVALAALLRPGRRRRVAGLAWLYNLLLLAFKPHPGMPMDGGRVLRALLWRARGDLAWATSMAAAWLGAGGGDGARSASWSRSRGGLRRPVAGLDRRVRS